MKAKILGWLSFFSIVQQLFMSIRKKTKTKNEDDLSNLFVLHLVSGLNFQNDPITIPIPRS